MEMEEEDRQEQGYLDVDGTPIWVKVIKTYYCHGSPVTRIVTDGKTIWETHDMLYPDLSFFYGACFVPQ